MGGEPLLHKNIVEMVQTATDMGVQPTMVTNGWLLPPKVDALADAGITTLFISIDAADPLVHEKNRGLKGVCARIREATAKLQAARRHRHRLGGDDPADPRLPGAGPLREGAGLLRHHLLLSPQGGAGLELPGLVGGQRAGRHVDTPSCWPPSTAPRSARAIIPVHNPRAGLADMRRRLTGAGRALHLPCRLQVLLHGLELRPLALRGLGRSRSPRSGTSRRRR